MLPQRIILLLGFIGILHSSMVPPVQQAVGGVCRYHQFMLRTWPFTRTYDVAGADVVALVSEYGIIVSVTCVVYLLAGLILKRSPE